MARRLPWPTSVAELAHRLAHPDRRRLVDAATLAAAAGRDPELFAALVRLLAHPRAVVSMRAADAIEKASRLAPRRLWPHRRALLRLLPHAEQAELRWHLAQMLPRLPLAAAERRRCLGVLESWLASESRIARVEALEALVRLAGPDPRWVRRASSLVERALHRGAPSERARARQLIRRRIVTGPRTET